MQELKKSDITVEEIVEKGLSQEASNYLYATGKCPVCDERLVDADTASFVSAGDLSRPCEETISINSKGCNNCSIEYKLPKPIVYSRELAGA
jgi:hypothetical protein